MVTFSDGSTITYTYGADGTKLKTVRKTGSTTTAIDSSMLPVNCQWCRPPTRTATPLINLPTNWVAGYCNAVSAPTGTTTPTMCTTTAAISALFFPRAFRMKEFHKTSWMRWPTAMSMIPVTAVCRKSCPDVMPCAMCTTRRTALFSRRTAIREERTNGFSVFLTPLAVLSCRHLFGNLPRGR